MLYYIYNKKFYTKINFYGYKIILNHKNKIVKRRRIMDKWNKRFMELTEYIATWSSCLRRQVGAIIVKDKRIIATGYNGAPTGAMTCVERGECLRNKLDIKSGTHAEICYSVHAEQNALMQAAKEGISVKGCVLYCTHRPCIICAKLIANAGIKEVIYKENYPDEFIQKFFDDAGVKLTKYEDLENQ